jgi:Ni/Fe-hydrogenase b-type cytochrome subunit
MKYVYFYKVYERIWHWIQALAIVGLLLTGLEIHLPDHLRIFGFASAISIHNVLGFVLAGNALLALFYHLATGEIRQFVPKPQNFVATAVRQAKYYIGGIFRNEPHPMERTPQAKLNPLQKITYLIILNVLLPLQVISGLLIWGAQSWTTAVDSVGGLPMLAKIHTLTAWLFAAFLIMHIYLTTTGATPLAHIRAMVSGWDKVEEDHVEEREIQRA